MSSKRILQFLTLSLSFIAGVAVADASPNIVRAIGPYTDLNSDVAVNVLGTNFTIDDQTQF